MDLLDARPGPSALDVVGVRVAARRDAHDDAALIDAPLVELDALLGNAVADESAERGADGSAGTAPRECRCQWPGGDDRQPRDGDARRGQADEQRPDPRAGHRAYARARGCFRAEFRLHRLVAREAPRPRVVRHQHAHVLVRVPASRHTLVGALRGLAVAEQACHHAISISHSSLLWCGTSAQTRHPMVPVGTLLFLAAGPCDVRPSSTVTLSPFFTLSSAGGGKCSFIDPSDVFTSTHPRLASTFVT